MEDALIFAKKEFCVLLLSNLKIDCFPDGIKFSANFSKLETLFGKDRWKNLLDV